MTDIAILVYLAIGFLVALGITVTSRASVFDLVTAFPLIMLLWPLYFISSILLRK